MITAALRCKIWSLLYSTLSVIQLFIPRYSLQRTEPNLYSCCKPLYLWTLRSSAGSSVATVCRPLRGRYLHHIFIFKTFLGFKSARKFLVGVLQIFTKLQFLHIYPHPFVRGAILFSEAMPFHKETINITHSIKSDQTAVYHSAQLRHHHDVPYGWVPISRYRAPWHEVIEQACHQKIDCLHQWYKAALIVLFGSIYKQS